MSFDVTAEAYDDYMGKWSTLLAPLLTEFAGVASGLTALDVGSGPGALTAELVRRLGPASVAAIDPSPSFVAAVRERNPGIAVRQATADSLPFPDSTFDVTLAQLVVHFMPQPEAGLAEMGRVTRPGGVVAACVWDYAGGRGPLGPFWEAARDLDPTAVDESRLPGTRRGDLATIMTAAGLREVRETELVVRREYASFEDWWAPFTTGVGPGGAFVARLAAGDVARLRDRCRDMLPAGRFTLTAAAWASRGRPGAGSSPSSRSGV
jgi:SAM-dependent methyltransferase